MPSPIQRICPTCGVAEPHRCLGLIAARHAEAEMIVAAVMKRLQALKPARPKWNEERVRGFLATKDMQANFRGAIRGRKP